MNEKRSVTSYLLSIFLIFAYLFFVGYTIFTAETFFYSILAIILIGFLVVLTLKRSIFASSLLVITTIYFSNIFNITIDFLNDKVEPHKFFITLIYLLPFISIFIDIIVEKAFKYTGAPKSSFYYTDKDYTPKNKK